MLIDGPAPQRWSTAGHIPVWPDIRVGSVLEKRGDEVFKQNDELFKLAALLRQIIG